MQHNPLNLYLVDFTHNVMALQWEILYQDLTEDRAFHLSMLWTKMRFLLRFALID